MSAHADVDMAQLSLICLFTSQLFSAHWRRKQRYNFYPTCSDQLRYNLGFGTPDNTVRAQYTAEAAHPFPVIPEIKIWEEKGTGCLSNLQPPFPSQTPFSSSLALVVPPLITESPPSTPALPNEIIILQTKLQNYKKFVSEAVKWKAYSLGVNRLWYKQLFQTPEVNVWRPLPTQLFLARFTAAILMAADMLWQGFHWGSWKEETRSSLNFPIPFGSFAITGP